MITKIIKRNFFEKGDVIIDCNNKELIYIKPLPDNHTLVLDAKTNEELKSLNPHFFHPEFNPGYVSEIFS
jgi:signal peptidase I